MGRGACEATMFWGTIGLHLRHGLGVLIAAAWAGTRDAVSAQV